jgi:hypothetical protein
VARFTSIALSTGLVPPTRYEDQNYDRCDNYSETNALLSLWVIANAATPIQREFSQLVYIFEFLIETHRSNPYLGKLPGVGIERDVPRLTEER